ncbi:MAG: hypothetical protein WCG36_01965, partial [bacterium]
GGSGTALNGLITLGSSAARILATSSPNMQLQQITGNNFDLTFGGSYRIYAYSTISLGSGKVIFEGTGASANMIIQGNNTFTGGLLFKCNNAAAYIAVENINGLGQPTSAKITFGPGAQGTIYLEVSPTIVGLNTDPTTPGTPVILNDATARTLTVNNATANTFAGRLTEGTAKLSLIKGAVGTLTLSGDNNYTGTKTIGAGMLVAGHANALGTSGTIAVNNSGTFLGVAAGVTLTRDVTFGASTGLAIFFAADGTAGKLVASGTTIDLAGKTLKLEGTIKPGTYDVASFGTISGGTFTVVDNTGSGASVTYSGGTVKVTVTASGTVFKIL